MTGIDIDLSYYKRILCVETSADENPPLHLLRTRPLREITQMATSTSKTVRVAVTQAEPEWLDLPASVTKTCKLIAEAAAEKASLVAFPECWIVRIPKEDVPLPLPGVISTATPIETPPYTLLAPATSPQLTCKTARLPSMDLEPPRRLRTQHRLH